MQYRDDRVQCNIEELYVYIVLKLWLSCVFRSGCETVCTCILDSDAISKPCNWCMLFEHHLQIRMAVSQRCRGLYPMKYAHHS